MNNKTILITGSTSGIGLAGAEALGRLGWRVLVQARSVARGLPILEGLRTRVPEGRFELVTADLGELRQVTELADQVGKLAPALDALWYNAGVMTTDPRLSADGFEYQWAVNHLAAFALVRALSPRIEAAPQGRIVLTSSFAHHIGRVPGASGFGLPPGRYNGWTTYGDTKLANILMARELARRLTATKVTVHAFHPGYVKTNFGANGDPTKGNAASWLSFAQIPVEAGAETGVFLASADEPGRTTGRYWSSRRVRRGSRQISDENALRLWTLTETALSGK